LIPIEKAEKAVDKPKDIVEDAAIPFKNSGYYATIISANYASKSWKISGTGIGLANFVANLLQMKSNNITDIVRNACVPHAGDPIL
jgi:hypothetical protein